MITEDSAKNRAKMSATKNTKQNADLLMISADIGNTISRFGLYRDTDLLAMWQCATRASLTPDEARLLLTGFLRTVSEQPGGVTPMPADGIVSCVVPSLTAVWVEALEQMFSCRPLVLGPGIKTGLSMHYNDPAEVGSDRIADCVAARETYGCPVLVVDLGVSTSIMVVGEDGAFLGGLLTAGLELSARALSQAAARLPVVEIAKPRAVIGKNTRDAMQAGFVLGEVARIDGLVEIIWAELGYQTKVVITGSSAAIIAPLLVHDAAVDETLTLRGLQILYQHNRKLV